MCLFLSFFLLCFSFFYNSQGYKKKFTTIYKRFSTLFIEAISLHSKFKLNWLFFPHYFVNFPSFWTPDILINTIFIIYPFIQGRYKMIDDNLHILLLYPVVIAIFLFGKMLPKILSKLLWPALTKSFLYSQCISKLSIREINILDIQYMFWLKSRMILNLQWDLCRVWAIMGA